MYCQCRQREKKVRFIYTWKSIKRLNLLLWDLKKPHVNTDITMQRAAVNRLSCSHRLLHLNMTHWQTIHHHWSDVWFHIICSTIEIFLGTTTALFTLSILSAKFLLKITIKIQFLFGNTKVVIMQYQKSFTLQFWLHLI